MATPTWPVLNFEPLRDTLETVHYWTQIVGKIRLQQMPWLNHSWHVTLYVYPRGLTTGSMPYDGGTFKIDMDFIGHELSIVTSDGRRSGVAFKDGSVAG